MKLKMKMNSLELYDLTNYPKTYYQESDWVKLQPHPIMCKSETA